MLTSLPLDDHCLFSSNFFDTHSFCGRLWGDQSLCLQFPRLFKITTTKTRLISYILGNNTSLSWDLVFRRNLIAAEIMDLERLKSLLSLVHLTFFVPDAKAWIPSSSGIFSINFFFQPQPVPQILFLSTQLIFCKTQKSPLRLGPLLGQWLIRR